MSPISPIDTAPIDVAAERSELIARALAKASTEHAGQIRTGSGGLPYIEHPRMVAATLAERDYPDEILAAALLHDVVEDSDTTVEELRADFGEEIAGLVAALSDDESIESYRERKDEHRSRVVRADGDALPIYAADKLANMTTLHAAIEAEGIKVADEYEVALGLKLEVWEADAAMLRHEAPRLSLLDPLAGAISRLAADLRAADPHPCT
jgi:guanosine-3',5'-bis(diphosphate) 3'-pyrophosphohydrolase